MSRNEIKQNGHLKRFRNDSGTVTIEFLIALPLLLAIIAVTIAGFHVYFTITKYSRAGDLVSDAMSRYGSITPDEVDTAHLFLSRLTDNELDELTLRVNRITFLSKDDDVTIPDDVNLNEWYETDLGYYNVDASYTSVHSVPDGKDPLDEEFQLKNADIADILDGAGIPAMGHNAHVIYIELSFDYTAPFDGELVTSIMTAIDNYNRNVFISPRDPRGTIFVSS